MTEYGRGSGSEPWHPDDPLHGDLSGRHGGYPGGGHGGAHPGQQQGGEWDPHHSPQAQYPEQHYPGQQRYPGQQQYPGQGQYPPQQQYGGGWDGGSAGSPSAQGHGDPYGGQGQGDPFGGGAQPGDPYGGQGHGDPYGGGQHGGPYGGQGQGDPFGGGGQPGDPYGGQGHGDPYGGGQHGGPYGGQGQGDPFGGGAQPGDPYGDRQHGDPYGYPGGRDGYPPQHAQHPPDRDYSDQNFPGRRPYDPNQQAPNQQARQPQRPEPGPDADTGWDPGPDQGESAFFADDGDDDLDDGRSGDDDGGTRRSGRRGGRERRGGTKRRSGCACLVVLLVLGGGLGTAAWFGYGFYQTHFGDPPDFSGKGRGEVQVEIPEGSTLSDMGNILKKAGVVKSHDAFVAAAGRNEKANSIAAGIYSLRKEMSAAEAIRMLTDPQALNTLTIPEGRRAIWIYEAIDEKLGLEKGTTEEAAEATEFDLPPWAEDGVEGFLFPARYDVGKDTEPAELLKKMVQRARAEYQKADLEGEAGKLGKTPFEVLTIASLIQAEAQEDEEFGKVSRVIYNRLDKPMKLQFDSTINYAKGRSTLDVSIDDTKFDSPYNTYRNHGLPPGPIDNPGHQALEAALNPTEGDWLYFVTVRPGDTRFTADIDEHNRNVEDFNKARKENDD